MKEQPLFLKPRLRIFLSADIVGSTGLKQVTLADESEKIHDQHTIWFLTIQGFYVESAQALADEWSRSKNAWPEEELCFGESPKLWKTVGDEVLFEKVITDYRQVSTTLSCWIKTLERLRDFLRDKDSRLDVKSTAWLAGFPVVNKEVVLDAGFGEPALTSQSYFTESGIVLNRHYSGEVIPGLVIDYVGPAIDTGFRLASFASPRKFAVSVGIAYALSKTVGSGDGKIEKFRIMFDKPQPMKGVMGGRNYPIFWIDLSQTSSIARYEDTLIQAGVPNPELNSEIIQNYCEAFYDELGAYAFKPFIDERTEQQIKSRPPWYDEILKKMAANFNSEVQMLGASSEEGVDESGSNPSQQEIKTSATELVRQLKR